MVSRPGPVGYGRGRGEKLRLSFYQDGGRGKALGWDGQGITLSVMPNGGKGAV